jgi:hypothetical protein
MLNILKTLILINYISYEFKIIRVLSGNIYINTEVTIYKINQLTLFKPKSIMRLNDCNIAQNIIYILTRA